MRPSAPLNSSWHEIIGDPRTPTRFLIASFIMARMLLLLANFGKDEKPEPILAKISQETLADMIGTTRSRVSFFMNKFRKLGLIDYNGSIEVRSSLLNVVLHDEPHINT
jgi:CRP-like cAMP-binding protein